jgi:hypothetical protein
VAEVTGLTAGRMMAIEAASVIDGEIDETGHLILTTYGGTDIDAGYMLESVPAASTTVSGSVELATSAETITGTDTTRAVTPAGFAAALAPALTDISDLETAMAGKQALDSDLTAIAALTPTNDDVLQRKSGAWANRTMLQLGTDLRSSGSLRDTGDVVFDVKAYGAVGNGVANDSTSIQNAINACNTAGGGTVWFPPGTYLITTNPIKLYSGSTPTIVPYNNVTLKGAGSDGVTGTIIKQTTTGVDVIKGLNDGANGAQSLNCSVRDMCLAWGTATKTNSGNGIYLAQQSAGGPSFHGWQISNVHCINFQGSGKYGFNFESIIVSTITTCEATECANGFYLNGRVSGMFSSVSTSVTFQNCYANMGANAVYGFRSSDNTYISFVGCAVDYAVNATGAAYFVEGSNSVSFNGCGCELGGVTLTYGWRLTTDADSNPSTQVVLTACYMYQSKSSKVVSTNGTGSSCTLIALQSNSSVSGSTGVECGTGTNVWEINCSYSDATQHSGAGTFHTL